MRTLLAVGRLLLTAEQAGPDSAGSLVVERREGGSPIGQVFLERGRIRWASASGFNTGLLPLLAAETGIALEEIGRQLQLAVERGAPVEESLLRIAGLDEGQVRRALLRHTAAVVTFLALQTTGGGVRVLPPASSTRAGAPGRFAFTPLEVLSEVFASAPELSATLPPLPRVFFECGPDHRSALCFLDVSEPFLPALPIATFGAFAGGLVAAFDLLRQARRLRRGLFLDDERSSPFAGVVRAGDRGWAVTYEAPYLCVFRLSTSGEYGRILTQYRLGRGAASLGR